MFSISAKADSPLAASRLLTSKLKQIPNLIATIYNSTLDYTTTIDAPTDACNSPQYYTLHITVNDMDYINIAIIITYTDNRPTMVRQMRHTHKYEIPYAIRQMLL